jgi:hypothetical protein
MTPRDQYLLATIQAMHARGVAISIAEEMAFECVDRMVAEACKRWGHEYVYERASGPCYRCGEVRIVKCGHCDLPKGSGPGSCDCVPF